MKIKQENVHHMPPVLEAGILYVSEEFETAAHACPCGCGAKVRTPLGPTEWTIESTKYGPTLYPSVGNWQQSCKSHYWIIKGEIRWAEAWSQEKILTGRRAEELRRELYYKNLYRETPGVLGRLWKWVKNLVGE